MPSMNLINFEQQINAKILKRGQEYFNGGQVGPISNLEDGEYEIIIYGSELYEVQVMMDSNANILYSECTCPYDLGDICKHEVAAFYALRELYGEKKKPVKMLKQLLEEQSKEKLIACLLDLSRDIEGVSERLMFKFSEQDGSIESSRNLIRNSVERFAMGGFVSWKYVDDALQGAYTVLETIREQIEASKLRFALQLALMVLEEVADMIGYADDSSGDISNVMMDALGNVEEVCELAVDFSSEEEKMTIFQFIRKAAEKQSLADWEEDLLYAMILLCDTVERKNTFKEILNRLEHSAAEHQDDWRRKYELQSAQNIRKAFLEKTEDKQTVEAYMLQNIANDRFRKELLKQAAAVKDYNKLLSLLPRDSRKQWRELELIAYEGLGDVEKQRQILRELIVEGKQDYYDKLKALYPHEEWSAVRDEMLDELAAQSSIYSIYADIVIKEKLWQRLLVLCEQRRTDIERYYSYLAEDYAEEAKGIYKKAILMEAAQASNRSHYKAVCRLLKSFKRDCGKAETYELIEQLAITYKKRPAFLDELGKVK